MRSTDSVNQPSHSFFQPHPGLDGRTLTFVIGCLNQLQIFLRRHRWLLLDRLSDVLEETYAVGDIVVVVHLDATELVQDVEGTGIRARFEPFLVFLDCSYSIQASHLHVLQFGLEIVDVSSKAFNSPFEVSIEGNAVAPVLGFHSFLGDSLGGGNPGKKNIIFPLAESLTGLPPIRASPVSNAPDYQRRGLFSSLLSPPPPHYPPNQPA